MEPNNIEKLIKENFKDRSIEPSSEARERLISALNAKPKKKRRFWLGYGIAASLIIGLFFGGKLLLKSEPIENQLEISFEKELPEVNIKETPKVIHEIKIENNDIVLDDQLNPSPIKTNLNPSKKSQKTETVASKSDNKTQGEEQLEKINTLELKTAIENKNLVTEENVETLALKGSQTQFQYITPEHLLALIDTDSNIELIQNKTKLPNTYVESDRLLVEMEKQLFDEKNKNIFKKAGRQLKKIKETVANRNFEH